MYANIIVPSMNLSTQKLITSVDFVKNQLDLFMKLFWTSNMDTVIGDVKNISVLNCLYSAAIDLHSITG